MPKKKHKGPRQKMVMKDDDVAYRRRLLERWGFACIVCGREFADLACVTKEHVVPKSSPACMKLAENLAPSHHRCNKLRSTNSIIMTAKLIDEWEKKLGSRFWSWLNKHVPNRIVPPVALLPVRVPQFLELPEHLPGMR